MKYISAVLIIILLFPVPLFAGTNEINVKLGESVIKVPAPRGFHEISELSSETFKLASSSTPSQNRLLAVFVSEKDLGNIMKNEPVEFDRYMLLQTHRPIEDKAISISAFQNMVNYLERQQDKLTQRAKDKSNLRIDSAAKEFSSYYDISMKMKIGESVPLGVFDKKDNSMSIATLTKLESEAEGVKIDSIFIGATNLIRVQNKIIYAYVYANYQSQDDIEWARATSKQWVTEILKANRGSTPVHHSRNGGFLSDIEWSKIIPKALASVIVGGFLIIMLAMFKGLINLFKKKKNT